MKRAGRGEEREGAASLRPLAMPRSFLVKSKKAHSYHQPRAPDGDYGGTLESVLAQICAGKSQKPSGDDSSPRPPAREAQGDPLWAPASRRLRSRRRSGLTEEPRTGISRPVHLCWLSCHDALTRKPAGRSHCNHSLTC